MLSAESLDTEAMQSQHPDTVISALSMQSEQLLKSELVSKIIMFIF